MSITITKENIVDLDVDIIVNAAKKSLLGGSGVDGAIHKKAGPLLLEECRKLNGCETGEAKMTFGYNCKAKRIIHTVGPIYFDGTHNEAILLSNCYKNSLFLAENYRKENNLEKVSIAFPCISTGIYHYPKEEAVKVALNAVKKYSSENIDVIFSCFTEQDYNLYQKELNMKD